MRLFWSSHFSFAFQNKCLFPSQKWSLGENQTAEGFCIRSEEICYEDFSWPFRWFRFGQWLCSPFPQESALKLLKQFTSLLLFKHCYFLLDKAWGTRMEIYGGFFLLKRLIGVWWCKSIWSGKGRFHMAQSTQTSLVCTHSLSSFHRSWSLPLAHLSELSTSHQCWQADWAPAVDTCLLECAASFLLSLRELSSSTPDSHVQVMEEICTFGLSLWMVMFCRC